METWYLLNIKLVNRVFTTDWKMEVIVCTGWNVNVLSDLSWMIKTCLSLCRSCREPWLVGLLGTPHEVSWLQGHRRTPEGEKLLTHYLNQLMSPRTIPLREMTFSPNSFLSFLLLREEIDKTSMFSPPDVSLWYYCWCYYCKERVNIIATTMSLATVKAKNNHKYPNLI